MRSEDQRVEFFFKKDIRKERNCMVECTYLFRITEIEVLGVVNSKGIEGETMLGSNKVLGEQKKEMEIELG